jgi:cell division protein FtsQ
MGHLLRRRRSLLLGSAAFVLTLALLAGGWLWLRDSSLVAVDRVVVSGLSGPDTARLRQTLETAGRRMTTLRVQPDVVRQAVAGQPLVRDLAVRADPPHTLYVDVQQRTPVAILQAGSRRVAVSSDGFALPGGALARLPVIAVRTLPTTGGVRDRVTLGALALLADAPGPLLARLDEVVHSPAGYRATLREGPLLRLGPASRGRAKWLAAVSLLSAPSAKGALYVDVSLPERPVAGGLEDPGAQIEAAREPAPALPPEAAPAAAATP